MDEPQRDERPQEALTHLQTAATELIAACRVVLDIAEDLVGQSIKLIGDAGSSPPASEKPVEKIHVVRDDPADG